MVRARDWLALALVGIASTSVADDRPPTDLAVETGEKRVILTAPGGDMRSILLLDFTRGLSIDYREEYDGF